MISYVLPRISVRPGPDGALVYISGHRVPRKRLNGAREKFVFSHHGHKFILKSEGYNYCRINFDQTPGEVRIWKCASQQDAQYLVPILRHRVTLHGAWSVQPYLEPHTRCTEEQLDYLRDIYERVVGSEWDWSVYQCFCVAGRPLIHDYGCASTELTESILTAKPVRKTWTPPQPIESL